MIFAFRRNESIFVRLYSIMRIAVQIFAAASVLVAALSGGAASPVWSFSGKGQTGQTIAAGQNKDTSSVADSLKVSDSLAVADSLVVPDSLGMADSLAVADSLGGVDSTFIRVYSKAELRQMHRDSVRHVRDSIKMATPRVLMTCAFPDSLAYRRILVWNSDSKVDNMTLIKNDSTFNDWYSENPVFKRDIDAVYLGMSGSAALSTNWFKRTEFSKFKGYEPWIYGSYTPETMPMYNVKSTYTELGYWGTLFAFKDKEEANVKILHTQNISPALNLAFLWQSYGGKGLMTNEETRNKTLAVTGNYLGKHYVANFGFIHNNIYRQENGGASDTWQVRDTTLEAKAVNVRMKNASNDYSRNSFFIHHHYSLAFRDVKAYFENRKHQKAAKVQLDLFLADSIACANDTLGVVRDSLMIAAGLKGAPLKDVDASSGEEGDTTSVAVPVISRDDGSMITFGHIGELTRFYRLYKDVITAADTAARSMYNNHFFIDPTTSHDSTRTFSLENRVFVRLQPWGVNAIVSKVDAGIGHEFVSHYAYRPEMYLTGNYNEKFNNVFIYGGASGKYRKYLNWYGDVRYDLMGYSPNDFEINAGLTFSFFPFRNNPDEGVDVTGRFHSSLKKPDYFSNYYYSNHYVWDHDFDKVSKLKIEGELNIKKWQFSAFFGYGITGNHVYYDDYGYVQQYDSPINVMTAGINKNFILWKFHLDNQVLCQISSKQDIIPLPLFTAHCRWYIEFPIVSPQVMKMQIGADCIYNTKYYMPMWNPALGQYQTQHREKMGGTPYLDAFVNVQWKKVTLFVKCTNVAQGWAGGDYFSAYSYIRPTRNIKIGVFWPFYF